jgi:hypothetical protein
VGKGATAVQTPETHRFGWVDDLISKGAFGGRQAYHLRMALRERSRANLGVAG